VAVWASVASVLLEVCGARENVIVEFAGRTSQGKSSVQELAASVWGAPIRVARTWKGSAAGHESYIASIRNLPPILDDTKKARSAEIVTEVVYMHSGGQGATRAQPGKGGKALGQRAIEEWRSVLLSSGENRCTTMGEHGGAAARALVFWGSPLADKAEADAVKALSAANHGHLGPRVLRWLLEEGNKARVRKALSKALATHAATLSAHSPVTGRLADVVAYIDVAGKLLGHMGLPAPECDVVAACHMAAVEGGEQADRPAAAFLALFDVAASQPARLWHSGRTDGEEPHQGWLGVKSPDAWEYIALRPVWVYEQIKIRGYDKEVVEQWKSKGWIAVDSAGKSSIATTTWMGKQRMIRMQRAALEALGGRFDGQDALDDE
jgi:hypothetical protein